MKPMAFTEGDIERFQTVVWGLADYFLVPGRVSYRSPITDPFDRFLGGQWTVDSIENGAIAAALYLDQLSQALDDHSLDGTIHQYLETAIANLTDAALPHTFQLGLFSGLTGFCYAVYICTQSGAKYQQLLTQLDQYYLESLNKKLSLTGMVSDRPWSRFDVISGSSGVIRYLLRRMGDSRFLVPLEYLLEELIQRSSKIHTRDGFFVVPEYLPTERHLRGFPDGYIDLGMAHGLPGILAALSIARLSGYRARGLDNAIDCLVDTILCARIQNGTRIGWPYGIGPRGEYNGYPAQLAWCYGAPGVAFSLALASAARKNISLGEFANEVIQSLSSQDDSLATTALNPCMCHGSAGLFHILRRFARLNNCSLPNAIVSPLHRALFASWSSSSATGFTLSPDGSPVPAFSLLEGSIGCALPLVSLLSAEPLEWDEFFLLA